MTTTTTPTPLPVEIIQSGTGLVTTDEILVSLNSTAVAQVTTFTVSGTLGVGDDFTVTLEVGSYSFKYMYESNATDTVETVGQRLARLIDSDPNVTASSAFATGTATVTVRSANPGEAFTLTTGVTGTATVSAANTTTAAAGTPLKRKLMEAKWTASVTADGFLQVTGQVVAFDGAAVPVARQTQTTAPYKHVLSLDAIRAEQSAT